MKTTITIALTIIFGAIISFINFKPTSYPQAMSDLTKANIETLMDPESGNVGVIICYSTLRVTPIDPSKYEPVWSITDCNGCKPAQCYEYKDSGTCIKKKKDDFILCSFN